MNKKLRYGFALTALLLLAPTLPRVAQATVIGGTFNVSGSYTNTTGFAIGSCAIEADCGITGTMTIDTTAGTATGWSLTTGGLLFTTIVQQYSTGSVYLVSGNASSNEWSINLFLDTSPTPGSLVNLTGATFQTSFTFLPNPSAASGSIVGGGTIVPATVPEPGTLALLAAGLLGLGFVMWRRRLRAPLA